MRTISGTVPHGALTIASRTAFTVALVAVNAAVISFYALWHIADTAAVNRAEEHGFAPQQFLPHATAFWFAAHASLLSVLILDVIAMPALRRAWRHRRASVDAREPVPRAAQSREG